MPNPPMNWSSQFLGNYSNAPQQRRDPNQVQAHGGSGFGFRSPTGSVVPRSPSQQFGQQVSPGPGPQAGQQQNDFMSQLRSFMQQYQPQQAPQQQPPAQQQMSQFFGQQGGQGGAGVPAGDFLAEAFLRDYANQAGAREQLRNTMGGFIGGLGQIPAMGMMGVDAARQSGQQGMDIAQRGAQDMMREAGRSRQVAGQTRRDVQGAMGAARTGMQKGVDTMQEAVQQHDFFRKDTVASGLQGVQSQFQSAKDQIMSNPNLSDMDKQTEIENLNNTMRQQAASYASQADSQAADAAMQARNVLGNMQMQMGSTMGALGLQGAGLSSSAGMQSAAMTMEAAQQGAQLMAAQSQFAGSLAQSAMAQAMQANLQGNVAAAQLAMQMPLGAPNLADTILAMLNAQGMRPGHRTTEAFGGRLAGLVGTPPGFAGYENRTPTTSFGGNMPYRPSGSSFG